jgi:gas vesicle protein
LFGYKFGDLSKGLAKKATSAINEMTGKESYEVSIILLRYILEYLRPIQTISFLVSFVQFGDLSRHLDKMAKSRVNAITEQDEYLFGDLSKWADSQVKLKLTNFTGKGNYQIGDISKEIIRRVQTGEYELQDILFLCKVLMTFGVGLTPVASFLPAKLLLEMVQFSVVEETSGRLLNALWTTLDQRFKETLTGDANYKLGDKTKEAIQNVMQKAQEQVTENVSNIEIDKEMDAALIDELDDWDRRVGITAVKSTGSSK